MSGHLVQRLVEWLHREPIDLDGLDGVQSRHTCATRGPVREPVARPPGVESENSHPCSGR